MSKSSKSVAAAVVHEAPDAFTVRLGRYVAILPKDGERRTYCRADADKLASRAARPSRRRVARSIGVVRPIRLRWWIQKKYVPCPAWPQPIAKPLPPPGGCASCRATLAFLDGRHTQPALIDGSERLAA
jgi:hypothetical protein